MSKLSPDDVIKYLQDVTVLAYGDGIRCADLVAALVKERDALQRTLSWEREGMQKMLENVESQSFKDKLLELLNEAKP